jgi:arsenate reductase (glutaredoxin)
MERVGMTLNLHGIANCDTVKKARLWLEAHGIAYTFRDYKKLPPAANELHDWVAEAGAAALINRSGTTWRKLLDTERGALENDPAGTAAIALMVANPSLIRRPIVTGAGAMLIGFKPAEWQERLVS